MKTCYMLILLVPFFLVACGGADVPENPNNSFVTAEQNKGSWTWLPVDNATCRDGSATGIGVRLQENADNLMIYLQGGGACYDLQSCEENANAPHAGENFSKADFDEWVAFAGNKGVFNISQNSNPVGDWHHVYISYCTGDLHGGVKTNASVADVQGLQQFVGHQNMSYYLTLLKSYFNGPREIVLAGASAGGFGVLFNYTQVTDAFAPATVDALVDAAPIIVHDGIETSCFEEKLINTFNLQVPQACTNCTDAGQGGLVNLYSYLGTSYPQAEFALGSADADIFGVVLFDRESVACGGSEVNFINYRFGLNTLRDDVLIPAGNWSTFFWGGIQHTFTQSDVLYFNTAVKGITASEWFQQVISGDSIHIAP